LDAPQARRFISKPYATAGLMFLRYLIYGGTLLFVPWRAWAKIDQEPYQPLVLALYTLVLAGPLFVFRGLGNLWLGYSALWAGLEALLFVLICVGTALSIGLFLIPCARFAHRSVNDGHAMRLALFSATPLWFWALPQVAPIPPLRTFFLLASLAHASLLLFVGLPRLFATEPLYTLTLSLLLAGTWVLSVVLLTQVFLGMAFAL
jgi:hypothetical protein